MLRLPKTTATAETQCGTWAAFKMVKYLMRCTGDAIRRLGGADAINGIGASIPMTADGQVYLLLRLQPARRHEVHHGDGWTCCTGTLVQATADCCDLIYFKDQDDLCVNLLHPRR